MFFFQFFLFLNWKILQKERITLSLFPIEYTRKRGFCHTFENARTNKTSMIASVSTFSLKTTTSRERKRILSSAFATSSRCSRLNFPPPLVKRREAFKPRSSSSSSSSSRAATTLEEHNKNTMTPIQLQDVARKHFENRERTRAQMVRPFFLLERARANYFFSRSLTQHIFTHSHLSLFQTRRWNDAWKSFARETLHRRTERRRLLTNRRRIFLAVG